MDGTPFPEERRLQGTLTLISINLFAGHIFFTFTELHRQRTVPELLQN